MTTLQRPRAAATQNIWKIAPGPGAEFWDECLAGGFIVVGWNELGDLSQYVGGDEKRFQEDFRKAYSNKPEMSIQQQSRMLWRFLNEVQVGDVVVANKGRSVVVGRGVVEGDYEYRANHKTYRNVRKVRWIDTEERVVGDQGGGWMRTLIPLTPQTYAKLFPDEDDADVPTATPAVAPSASSDRPSIYDFLAQQEFRFPDELVTSYLLALKSKPFVILSGISGTGKTKLAQLVAEWAGTEEREVELTVPEEEAIDSSDEVWVYELRPYNFKHGKIVISFSARAEMFDLPEQGTVDVPIVFEGKTYTGGLGAIQSDGRLLHELRFRKELTETLNASAEIGDFVLIRIERPDDAQVIHIERLAASTQTKREKVERHTFISVRPDWTDGKGILGFFNVLTERYSPTPFLRRMLEAFAEPSKPHFVTLDEMNLARVEHYFSDLLSAMESRREDEHGAIVSEPLHLHDLPRCLPLAPLDGPRPAMCNGCKASDAEMAKCRLRPEGVAMAPPALRVPPNLFITGTVNIDETTHMFSPKVLDRANVLEFNEVRLDGFGDASSEDSFRIGNIELGPTRPATLKDFKGIPEDIRAQIVALHDVLTTDNLHFGYRVANEMGRFIQHAIAEVDPEAAATAVDLQIVQKVLPKLHGTKQRLQEPLWRLLQFAAWGQVKHGVFSAEAEKELTDALKTAKYPRAAQRLARMRQRLKDTGFASFIE